MSWTIVGYRNPIEYTARVFRRGSRWTFAASIEADELKAATYSTARAAADAITRRNTQLSLRLGWPCRVKINYV